MSKFYIVSASELDAYIDAAIENYINPDHRERISLLEAEAACRAREVVQVDLKRLLDIPNPNANLTPVWKEIKK